MYKINQIINHIRIEEITYEGFGAIRNNNHLILIQGVLMNEVVDIQIYKTSRKISYARVIKITEKSPLRLENLNKNLMVSGAALLATMPYDEQLKFKQKWVNYLYSRSLNYDNVLNIQDSKIQWEYRNKIIVFIENNSKLLKFALKELNSNNLITQNEFILSKPIIQQILSDMTKQDKNFNDYFKQNFESIMIRCNHSMNQVQLTLNSNSIEKMNQKISAQIFSLNKNIKSIILKFNNKVTDIIGSEYINDSINNIEFNISSKSFYQINHEQTSLIYNQICDLVKKINPSNTLDLYSGIGTITLMVAKSVKNIIGVEIIEDAVIDARNNAKINGISNAKFIYSDVANLSSSIFNDVELLIVDPPRSGLDGKAIKMILKNKFKHIIYLSCNIHTQLRDLRAIHEFYEIESVQPFDMFPQTPHIEILTHLKLKTN